MGKKDKSNKSNNQMEVYKNYSDFYIEAINRRVKNLNKKYEEIQKLKKMKKGTLNDGQISKIERE